MENASKALLIAGEILIGILLLTITVLLISQYGGTAEKYEERVEAQNIEKFNLEFLRYVEHDSSSLYVSAQDVMTFVNLANNYQVNDKIDIKIINSGGGEITSDNIWNNFTTDTTKMYQEAIVGGTEQFVFPIYYRIDVQYNAKKRIDRIKIFDSTKYYKYEKAFYTF